MHLPLPEVAPATARLEGERFHHLVRVLRAAVGDTVEVFDGRGRCFGARIAAIEADAAVVELGPAVVPRALRRIALVQGLPKGDKLDAVLRHGTELGASCFAPAFTERSLVKLDGARAAVRLKRWARIAEEAARQCGRADVPQVLPAKPLADAFAGAGPARAFVLDEEEAGMTLSRAFEAALGKTDPVCLVVGPEGGLSRVEVETLCALGAQPVSLGRRILRTETASLAALSVLLHLDGELG